MTDLSTLISRLEEATGADREIDAAVFVALNKPEQYPDDLRYYRLPHPSMDHMDMCAPGTYWLKQRSGASLRTSPKLTESLDAVLSLAERVLPGWEWAIFRYAAPGRGGMEKACARIFPVNGQHMGSGDCLGATPALALLAAVLKAKLSEQETQQDGLQKGQADG